MTTLVDLANHYKLTKDQLDYLIEDWDLLSVARLFGPWQSYTSMPGLGLREGQKQTILANVNLTDNDMRMEEALKMWKDQVTLQATFRNLIDMLLQLTQGNVAMSVCEYLCKCCLF